MKLCRSNKTILMVIGVLLSGVLLALWISQPDAHGQTAQEQSEYEKVMEAVDVLYDGDPYLAVLATAHADNPKGADMMTNEQLAATFKRVIGVRLVNTVSIFQQRDALPGLEAKVRAELNNKFGEQITKLRAEIADLKAKLPPEENPEKE